MIDFFSTWAEANALSNQEATTVTDVLVKKWICLFGVPLELGSRNFKIMIYGVPLSNLEIYC